MESNFFQKTALSFERTLAGFLRLSAYAIMKATYIFDGGNRGRSR